MLHDGIDINPANKRLCERRDRDSAGDYAACNSSMSGLDQRNAETEDTAILKETAEIMAKIKLEGTVGGDCGGCGKQDVPLYIDLCHTCTCDEVWRAVFHLKQGPLLEKYGL